MVHYLSCNCCSHTQISSSFVTHFFFMSCTLPVSQKQVLTLAFAIFCCTVVTIHESTPVELCFVYETQIVQHMNLFMRRIMKQMAIAAVVQA